MDFTYFDYIDYVFLFGLLGILFFVLSIMFVIISEKTNIDKWFDASMVSFIAAFVFFVAGIIYYNNSPKPIDVYNGKTELKVRYVGDKAVDSVVVFKEKEKIVEYEKKYKYKK